MNRRLLLHAAVLLAPFWLLAPGAQAADKIKVAASFSVLGDMVRQIGGDRVDVTAFVGPNGDAHVYEPTPGDAKTLAASAVLVINGLGLEGWMTRLQKSSGFTGKVVTATTGIKTRQMEEEEHGRTRKITDPHAWQSLANGKIYVANIRDGLIAADPAGKETYQSNAAKFLAEIDQVDMQVKAAIAKLPPTRRKLITTHDAFGYFGETYGMEFIAPSGVSTESEASARDVAKIIRQIKAEKIPAVFLENVTDHRLLDQIARETGSKIGGTLYSDALSEPSGPAGTYLDMFRHNIAALAQALSS
jgi:zinc/manganese transport system substrate-binding protein